MNYGSKIWILGQSEFQEIRCNTGAYSDCLKRMHRQRNSEREKNTRGYEQSQGDKYKNKAGNIAWKKGNRHRLNEGIQLAQKTERWRVLENIEFNLHIPQTERNFLPS
jgi:hypothetical protein